jgi:hypothetical protein
MKDFTRSLRKYHFWILLIVVIVVSAAGWYLTRNAVARQFNRNQGRIDDAFRKMEDLAGKELHPNDEYLKGGDELNEERKDSVWDAWKIKYEKQGPLFAWPDPSPEIPLEEAFLEIVADLRPFETKVPYPPDPAGEDLLRYRLREDYPLYIKEEVPKLAEIIGSNEWGVQGAQEPGGAGEFPAAPSNGDEGRGAAEKTNLSEIRWNPANQQQILADHFDWSLRPDPVPTTLEILYAQEDLWVYRALMKIIRETNGGTGSKGNLAIPQIEFIRIGKSAKWNPAPITGHGLGKQRSTKDEDVDETPAARHGGGGRGGASNAPTDDPADFRYVDMANQPLTGEKLRGTTGGAGAEQATLAVAKRMPVHMKMVIDQREINKLLVECGNSPLMVEVQQLRFNPGGGVTNLGAADKSGPAEIAISAEPDYRTIELYGIISMYNPVNAGALGKEVAPEEEGAEEGVQEGAEEGTETAVKEAAEETAEEDTGEDAADGTDTTTDTATATPAADAATEPADGS